MTEYLILSEVVAVTGISPATLTRWCREGKIAGARQTKIKIGRGHVWEIPDSSLPALKALPEGKKSVNYGTKNKSPLTG